MSPRNWLRRPFAALLAVWFALVMVEPAALHSCPVHAGHAAAGHGPAAGEPAPSVGMAGGAHSAHMSGASVTESGRADDAGAPGSPHHADCTCPGACTASSGAIALPAAVLVRPLTITIVGVSPIPTTVAPASARAPFILPFANGPPLLRTAA
jgi:hypothetical protein